jgi:hypothetical protein
MMSNLLLFTLDYIERDEYGNICCESYGYIIEATSITIAIMQFYAKTENYHIVMIREILKTSQEYQKVIGEDDETV